MKNKKLLISLIILFILILIAIILLFKNDFGVSFNLLRYDVSTDKTEVYKKYTIKEGSTIELFNNDEYKDCYKNASDIRIMEITDDYVKVSRDKRIVTGDEIKVKEVIEMINYDEEFILYLYESNNKEEALCELARYAYYGKFTHD